jgi:hypothetical protein
MTQLQVLLHSRRATKVEFDGYYKTELNLILEELFWPRTTVFIKVQLPNPIEGAPSMREG